MIVSLGVEWHRDRVLAGPATVLPYLSLKGPHGQWYRGGTNWKIEAYQSQS